MAITGTPIGVARDGIMFPGIGARISIPDAFVDTVRGNALHRKVSSEAARITLQWHHANVMREHFGRQNRNKYDHAKRTPVYLRIKRYVFRQFIDLIKTGKSRDRFLGATPRVTMVQSQPKGVIHAFMRYRWPFPNAGASSGGRGVTVGVMNREVTAWTDKDAQDAADIYARVFIKHYERELATRKKFRKLIGDVSARL